ncbi:MAG: FHA domain-containing protein [Clostridia bacterium]|nr:FHA domain-containing protein [Clostridia bacterium]
MDVMYGILAFLVALLLALIVIFVALFLKNRRSGDSSTVYGWGGIDLSNGRQNEEEIHGFHGVQYMTSVDNRRYRAVVYLEESLSRNQFRANLGDPVIIGRIVAGNPTINNLSVSASAFISRQHCKMFEHCGSVYVENLSKVGTIVNGSEIRQPTPIHQGDAILLGDVLLRVLAIETTI